MQTRFIITCAARTGSTMLRYLLDGHPEICCHGEVFIRKGYLRFIFKDRRSFGLAPGYKEMLESYKSKPLEEFISSNLLSTVEPEVKAVGFKYKTDEYFDRGYVEISAYLKSQRDIKVIHLRRRDLLAQYVSYVFVQKNYNPTVSFDKGGASSTNKLTIKKKSLFKYLDLVEYRDKKIRSELTNHTIHDVWYEDILEDRENRISGILEFLGVDIIDLQPTTRKLIKDYRSHIKNLSEVHGWLSSSPYAQRVDLQRAR